MAYYVTKKPWIGAILVFLFGAFGFLYYSWKKAVVVFLLFFIPNLIIYNLEYEIFAEVFRWLVQIILAVYAYMDLKGRLGSLEKLLGYIITVSTFPIIFANFFGEIVGGIWLLIIGEWQVVLFGVILSVIVPYMYLIVGIPQIGLVLLVQYFENKKWKKMSLTFGFINILIGYFFILLYVAYVANAAVIISIDKGVNIIALFLFGYGVATSPFSYMASKDSPDSTGSILGVYIAQISYIIIAILYVAGYEELSFPIVLIIIFGLQIYQMSIATQIYNYTDGLKS